MKVIRQWIKTMRNRACSRQGDLFGYNEPGDRDGWTTPSYGADPEKVRVELHKILAEARAAQTMPWDARLLLVNRTIFPQMTNWLPAEEAARLRCEFEAELARLEEG